MDSLIRKLEEATGPSRELDAEIVVALDIRPDWLRSGSGAMYVGKGNTAMGPDVLWLDARMKKRSGGDPSAWHGWHSFDQERVYPRFTSSLDAALTLVPEGFQWSLTDWRMEALAQIGATISTATAKTPALALVLASLKAIQSSRNTKPQGE